MSVGEAGAWRFRPRGGVEPRTPGNESGPIWRVTVGMRQQLAKSTREWPFASFFRIAEGSRQLQLFPLVHAGAASIRSGVRESRRSIPGRRRGDLPPAGDLQVRG